MKHTYLAGVVTSKTLQNGSSGNTKRAQTMENRLLESGDLSELRINVKRIVISRESVNVGLEGRSGSLLNGIRLTLRNLDVLAVGLSSALRFEVLGTNQENSRHHSDIGVLVVRKGNLVLDQSSLSSLVYSKYLGGELEGSFGGKRVQDLKVSSTC